MQSGKQNEEAHLRDLHVEDPEVENKFGVSIAFHVRKDAVQGFDEMFQTGIVKALLVCLGLFTLAKQDVFIIA
jgi:hypothetical protein